MRLARIIFFNYNCSYNILWLLEVARPSLRLRDEFTYQVIPTESIFALKKFNLITNIIYRPSKRVQILSYESVLDSSEVRLAKSLAKGKKSIEHIKNLNLAKQQHIVESAMLYNEYLLTKGKKDKDAYTQIAYNLASFRSTLKSSENPPIPTPSDPLQGNQAIRLTPLVLANTQGAHPALDFRIAYHDITDNDRGHLKGTQIEFMRTLAYFDTKQQDLRIYELNILSIASFGFMSKFFKPISFRVESGFNRTFLDSNLHYFFALGGGFAYQFSQYVYGFYLLEPTFFVHFHRPDFALSNAFGIILQNNQALKATLEYKLKAYSPQSFSQEFDSTLSVNLKSNLALLMRLKAHNHAQTHFSTDYMLGFRIYF